MGTEGYVEFRIVNFKFASYNLQAHDHTGLQSPYHAGGFPVGPPEQETSPCR